MSTPNRETADRWNRALRGFRFNFAAGGPTLDMDNLFGRVRFEPGEQGLLDLCRTLELPLRRVPGEQKPGTEACRDQVQPVPAYPAFLQPGFTTLFGLPVHLEICRDWLAITVTGARGFSWDVFEEDFQNALRLEKIFAQRGLAFVAD